MGKVDSDDGGCKLTVEEWTKAEAAVQKELRTHRVSPDRLDEIALEVIERAFKRWDPSKGALAPYAVSLVACYLADTYRTKEKAERDVDAQDEGQPTPEDSAIESDDAMFAAMFAAQMADAKARSAWRPKHDKRSLPVANFKRHVDLQTVVQWLDRRALDLLFVAGGKDLAGETLGILAGDMLIARMRATRTKVPDEQALRDRAKDLARSAVARHRPARWVEDGSRTRLGWRQERGRISRAVVNDLLRGLGLDGKHLDQARKPEREQERRKRKRDAELVRWLDAELSKKNV